MVVEEEDTSSTLIDGAGERVGTETGAGARTG
jgi:hypothetical protein